MNPLIANTTNENTGTAVVILLILVCLWWLAIHSYFRIKQQYARDNVRLAQYREEKKSEWQKIKKAKTRDKHRLPKTLKRIDKLARENDALEVKLERIYARYNDV